MVEQGQQHTTATMPDLHVVIAALPHTPATLMPHLLQHPRFLCFYFSSPHKANLAQSCFIRYTVPYADPEHMQAVAPSLPYLSLAIPTVLQT